MTKYTFEHIHLLTPDPEGTAAWYERMFGAPQIVRSMPDGKPRIDLKLGGMDIFVLPVDPRRRQRRRTAENAASGARLTSGCASTTLMERWQSLNLRAWNSPAARSPCRPGLRGGVSARAAGRIDRAA